MSIRNIKSSVVLILLGAFLFGCAKEMDTTFQQTRPAPEVRLLRVFDETPAIKSMFSNIDEAEFNRRANDMLNANPELSAQLFMSLGSTFYGSDAVLPQTVKSMADGLKSFHKVYSDKPNSLDATFDVVSDVLSIDSEVMMDGVESITNVLEKMRNWDDANGNGVFETGERLFYDANNNGVFDGGDRYFYWDLFAPYQELDDIGYDGINLLIENFNFVYNLYDGAENLDDPKVLVQNFFQAIVDTNKDVEKTIADVIDYLENPKPGESVRDIEEEIADWMVADPVKVEVMDYLISKLYPIVKDPALQVVELPADFETLELPDYLKEEGVNSEEYYKNFIRRGRWVLDEQMKILSATPIGLSKDPGRLEPASEDPTLLTQWLVDAFSKDVMKWDDIESVEIFDFDNNELLRWLGKAGTYDDGGVKYSIGEQLKKSLSLNDTEPGILKSNIKALLWDGITYTPTSGGSKTYKGLMYCENPGSSAYNPNDGYLVRSAKFKSEDGVAKPFREQAFQRLNKQKAVSPSYIGEGQIEAVLTNLQLHILQDYYSTKDGKYRWSLTPEDGQEFFGNPDKNLQTFVGGLTQSLRNAMYLNRDGKRTSELGAGESRLSALSELLYVLAASYGVVDPNNAPGELSVRNCLKSMGSPLGDATYITTYIDLWLFKIPIKIPALGGTTIRRNGVNYTTQHDMPANELLQPGTFRRRTDVNTVYPDWHGKFAPSQGDIIGSADANGNLITTNWNMTEIALAAWEGYGPYTYRGKAPNGGKVKYKNYFDTDEYHIEGRWESNKGPGVGKFGWERGRYRIYEAVYAPALGEDEHEAVDPSFESDAPKYGYIRESGADYDTVDTATAVKVTLDCDSREEAIRKNVQWLFNQKKYIYVIPIHVNHDLGLSSVKIEIFAYSLIMANGIAGVANARRHGPNLSDNAIWGSGVNTNYRDGDNYYLNLVSVDTTNRIARLERTSFADGDYCVAIDYRYYMTGWLSGLAALMVDMTKEIWGCLGNGRVLPRIVGDNLKVMLTMANKTYKDSDLISAGYSATDSTMAKFGKYFAEYYPELNLVGLRDDQLPPVPRVQGVTYPTGFDSGGNAIGWTEHLGTDKGLFDDFLNLLAMIVGTIHEDGDVCTNGSWNQDGTNTCTSFATAEEIDEGQFTYFARNGFRAQLDNFILTTLALNQTKNIAGQTMPEYNTRAITNILVDHDPALNQTIAGSRKGILPSLLNSKYANINYVDPIKKGLGDAIRHVIRSYLNSYELSRGPDGGVVDLCKYYQDDERTIRNPDINWNVPLNRLSYFADNISLDQLKRTLDMFKDLSQDADFVDFLKKSIPAVNNYLYIKWLDENWDGTGARPSYDEAVAAGLFSLEIEDGDIEDVVEFLKEFEYAEFIKFVQDNGINDIEGLYNFSFETWGKGITQTDLYDQIGNLNETLVKYFGVNLLEGAVHGIYEVKETVMLSDLRALAFGEDDEEVFLPGDKIYGRGKYVEWKNDGTYEFDKIPVPAGSEDTGIVDTAGLPEFADDMVYSGDRYYRYVNVGAWLDANKNKPAKYEVVFKGLLEYVTFRSDSNEVFQEYCLNYKTVWFTAGNDYAPNLFSLHNYDLRMDKVMEELDSGMISYEAADFQTGVALVPYEDPIGKNDTVVMRPATIIDWLYGYNGGSFEGMSLQKEINFAKNVAIDKFFDGSEYTVPNPNVDFAEDYKATPRHILQDYRDYLFENVLEYEYAPGKKETYYTAASGNDTKDMHRHAINNITELIVDLLGPDRRDDPSKANPYYVTGALFESWQRFIEVADIDENSLKMVQEAVGNLLWDPTSAREQDPNLLHLGECADPELPWNPDTNPKVGNYTHLFSNMTAHTPGLMKKFQGMYGDLIQLGLLSFSDDGIGSYLLDVMEPASSYDSWDLVEEFNYLINTDIFQDHIDRDTFWWQAGNLIEDMAILLIRREERKQSTTSMDYFGAVSGLFK